MNKGEQLELPLFDTDGESLGGGHRGRQSAGRRNEDTLPVFGECPHWREGEYYEGYLPTGVDGRPSPYPLCRP